MILRAPILASALFGAAFCFLSGAASAYTISLTGGTSGGNPGGQPLYEVSGLVQGDAFNLSWGGVTGLNVTGTVTVNSLTASTASIQVLLNNLNTPISGADPRVTSVGLEIDNFTSLSSALAGGTYLANADTSNFPGFTIDACATSGNNCSGGGNGGIPASGTDNFTLAVNGAFGGTLDLSNFGLKVQGGPGGNSFELAGVPNVPEPGTIGMVVVAGLMISAVRRKS